MQACASQPVQIKTEYVYIHDVPEVVFPIFPPPDTVTFDPETETVSMPLWYWQEIAEYKLSIDAIRDYFTILRGYDDVKKMKELKERGIKKIDNAMRAMAVKTRKKVDRELGENRN
jgi:hypothetical protein